MEVQTIAPGLWRWTTEHPDWTLDEDWDPKVGSVYYEASDATVLIDPLVPVGEADRFWEALRRDLERTRGAVHVLLTLFWHARSANEILDRFPGARVWAHEPARELVAERTRFTDLFRPGQPLPGGIEALDAGRAYEVLFWIPDRQALVAGDVLHGDGAGGVRLLPESWLGSADRQRFRARMLALLELPVEHVLTAHGDPILEGGQAALARALEQ